MFGLKYSKFQPNEFVFCLRSGRLLKQGAGLAFWYYEPACSLSVLPAQSLDADFFFEELTQDFAEVSLQGRVVFRIANFGQAAAVLNFAAAPVRQGYRYLGDGALKLPQRILGNLESIAKKRLGELELAAALNQTAALEAVILEDLRASADVAYLGIEIVSLSLMDVLASKELQRAMEARRREAVLQDADDAMYLRRNSSIDQERAIKENEFNTEISAENKQREVGEARIAGLRAVQAQQSELDDEQLEAAIALERKRRELAELAAENARIRADAQAYELSALMKALESADPMIVQALASVDMGSEQLIALAFQNLARNAEKVGQLNISPDLLSQLVSPRALPGEAA